MKKNVKHIWQQPKQELQQTNLFHEKNLKIYIFFNYANEIDGNEQKFYLFLYKNHLIVLINVE